MSDPIVFSTHTRAPTDLAVLLVHGIGRGANNRQQPWGFH